MWYRVFGVADTSVEPAELLEFLHGVGLEAAGRFKGDERGWFRAELVVGDGNGVEVERYLAEEEGIRGELNTWAAWLETREDNPHHDFLLRQVVGTRQVFTLQPQDGDEARELCLAVCRYLARATGGIYQVDGQGLYSAEGTLLVEEA